MPTFIRLALAAAMAVVAVTAHAGTPEDIAEAERLLRIARDDKALQILYPALDRGDASGPQLAQLFVLLGVARFNLRDEEGARLAFRRALDADAAAVLPRLVSPKTRALFDEVRVAATASRSGKAAAAAAGASPPEATRKPPAGGAPTALSPATTSAPLRRLELPDRKTVGVGVAVAGVAAGLIGGFFLHEADGLHTQAVAEPSAMSAYALYKRSLSDYWTGLAFVGSGAIVAAAGVALALWPRDSSARTAWVFSGTGVSFTTRF